MRRYFPIVTLILLFVLVGMVIWISNQLDDMVIPRKISAVSSEIKTDPSVGQTASEYLLDGYGDSGSPPIDDLRKIYRVGVGYFSLVKDSGRFSIGGNADFSAALQGENPNRQVFVRKDHPVFSKDGLLQDRWGSPLMVHPEAWRQLELRSAGPDRTLHTLDDLVLDPSGASQGAGVVR